ncbi:hypothetical protein DM558_02965 [Entomomonas moraniae]|uniref:Uncharacterized protein n=1 Tax=Entomomonas moraniae TaxID=2213226 RepID=A0A3S9XBI1_9GAMM|nr:hypothetical protein DM558_02965 [Entomomonas moraniae]
MAGYILNLKLELDSIKSVEKMKEKRQTLSKRIVWLKQFYMERCGITEIKMNDDNFTSKLNKGRASVVVEDDETKFLDDGSFVK